MVHEVVCYIDHNAHKAVTKRTYPKNQNVNEI